MKSVILFACLLIPMQSFAVNLAEGQVWKYKTRVSESGSTITILKVERYSDLGEVIHIRVDNINMINPKQGNEINEIPHLPFQRIGIEESVTELTGFSKTLPEYSEGYDTWKEAYQAGQAGAFDGSVKETLGLLLGAEWVEKE